MRVLTKKEAEKEKIKLVRKLRDCLFIHPTDTVYGLGCNAEKRALVRKLRFTKEQYSRPMSVIAPSMKWIRDNCEVQGAEEWLEKLPGPYTLIFKLKNKDAIAKNVNLGKNTVGVRMPDHWITNCVHDIGTPVITTSANITGKNIMISIEDLDEKLEKACDYALYEGPKEGKPSKVVDLTKKEEPKVLRN